MVATRNSTIRDTGHHDRRLARRLQDPKFRAPYDRECAEIAATSSTVNRSEWLGAEQYTSKDPCRNPKVP